MILSQIFSLFPSPPLLSPRLLLFLSTQLQGYSTEKSHLLWNQHPEWR